jgi:hypothetical protein
MQTSPAMNFHVQTAASDSAAWRMTTPTITEMETIPPDRFD